MACYVCGNTHPRLVSNNEEKIYKCDYCGTRWNVGDFDADYNGESIQGLLAKAIELRNDYKFDDALELYDEILRREKDNRNAIFGRVCCKYGVVHVIDQDNTETLTCHKLLDKNIVDDEDYQRLKISHWTYDMGKINQDIQYISEIQEKVKNIQKDETHAFDIFICYKQSTLDRARQYTVDTFDAELLYYTLRKEGYRVFFAKDYLKGKSGAQYEAEIFNAIVTSRVMLVLGSEPEYFTSPWVRSEWQRYLASIKGSNDGRTIIPIYKNMRVEQLPKRLAQLQAIDFEMDEKDDFSNLKKRVKDLLHENITKRTKKKYTLPENIDETARRAILKLADKDANIRLLDHDEEKMIMELDKSDSGYSAYILGCINYIQGNNKESKDYFEKAERKGIVEAREQLIFMQENGVI